MPLRPAVVPEATTSKTTYDTTSLTRRRFESPRGTNMKKLVLIFSISVAACVGLTQCARVAPGRSDVVERHPDAPHGDQVLAGALANHQSNVEVQGSGVVTKILADDNDGSRHQRFILRLASGQTVLIAHNLDISNKIDNLKEGDQVLFKGEYEWNPKGGVIHWTHHDPAGRHSSGSIQHNGQTYQ